jgi:hypothetical protein
VKTSYKTLATAFGVLAFALSAVPNCAAQCGSGLPPRLAHSNWHSLVGRVQLLPAAFVAKDDGENDDAAIVGFWHQQLLIPGTDGNDTIFDNALAQWHSDGTELQNTASHPPVGGSFCMGVWKKVGSRTYKLNHFPLIWDPTGSTFMGPANLREQITVSADGKQYQGTFTQDFYDPTGKILLAHYQGTVTGTRITLHSTAGDIF